MKKLAQISWQSPSNIAFIKYWGKRNNQYPMNPSLSMTLEKCFTTTEIEVFEKEHSTSDIDFSFTFEHKENKLFERRINTYLHSINDSISILEKYRIQINSSNSFPHSAGIASSASAMSALALCLTSLEEKIGNGLDADFKQTAAILARLGSGSATRSLFGGFSLWGSIDSLKQTSDDYGIELPFTVHDEFVRLRDTILIINSSEKKVSSSVGHSLMDGHPYAGQRYNHARDNLNMLLDVLNTGCFEDFARILESEALSLHAMMLTANPWYSLLAPNTLVALQLIRNFREITGAKVTFTLDAGPNVHIIYPDYEAERVNEFIRLELVKLCSGGRYITDNTGKGPELLNEEYY